MIKLRTLGMVFALSLLTSTALEIYQSGRILSLLPWDPDYHILRLILLYSFLYSAITLVFIALFRLLARLL